MRTRSSGRWTKRGTPVATLAIAGVLALSVAGLVTTTAGWTRSANSTAAS